MTYEEFAKRIPIARETYDKLRVYHDLLIKWQRAVNLVSPSTLSQVWERHILDSAELIKYIPNPSTVADIGSGAGFPGLVLAICGVGKATLIESDRKKCEFLKEAARVTGADAIILNERAENIKIEPFDFVTSRATANLDTLLEWSFPLMDTQSICLFHKGENWATETEAAKHRWLADIEVLPAASISSGCIIKVTNLSRRT